MFTAKAAIPITSQLKDSWKGVGGGFGKGVVAVVAVVVVAAVVVVVMRRSQVQAMHCSVTSCIDGIQLHGSQLSSQTWPQV